MDIGSDYITPVTVEANILCGSGNAPACGGTHTGSAGDAVDIAVNIGTSVRNSATSHPNTAGWDNSGYDYLVTMYDDQNGYIAYYGHLSSINYSSLYTHNPPVPQGHNIGQSGDTGAGGAHLHFHVQDGGAAVDLVGMPGLTLTANYPNCNCGNDCNCIESLPGEQCVCGSVN